MSSITLGTSLLASVQSLGQRPVSSEQKQAVAASSQRQIQQQAEYDPSLQELDDAAKTHDRDADGRSAWAFEIAHSEETEAVDEQVLRQSRSFDVDHERGTLLDCDA